MILKLLVKRGYFFWLCNFANWRRREGRKTSHFSRLWQIAEYGLRPVYKEKEKTRRQANRQAEKAEWNRKFLNSWTVLFFFFVVSGHTWRDIGEFFKRHGHPTPKVIWTPRILPGTKSSLLARFITVSSVCTDARGMSVSTMKNPVFAILQALLVVSFAVKSGDGQRLSPPAINIAQGKKIEATSTCGEDVSESELFCKLATVPGKLGILGLSCDHCDPSVPSRDHSIEYAIDGTERWWQSPPLSRGLQYQRVNITIDLGQVKVLHRPRCL